MITNAPASVPDFVGIYDGNSFETAMGMQISADGSYQWGLSVGSLDMRSSGAWTQNADQIAFTTMPAPVAAEFQWSGYEDIPSGPLVKVLLPNGNAFPYADIRLECASGKTIYDQVPREGWSPPNGECDAPQMLQLSISSYDVRSEEFDLIEAIKLDAGKTLLFKFHRNDMGIADFTGMYGTLEDGRLELEGARWPMTLRKRPPQSPNP